ncbi:MAG: hypothetical protein M3340_20045 [Actinomycetota bacterium]|nr:hypothetical protein [Actinomycetota bacterium]
MPTQHPQFRYALPAYAAFKPADVPEARARQPGSDLTGYAQSRGLEYLGSRSVVRPMHRPRPFAEPLPPAAWPVQQTLEQELSTPALFPPAPYVPGMLEGAARRGWTPEDSTAYHLAFPDLPVPGTAFAVMRFTPPGASAFGRLAWHAEMRMSKYNIGRNAVLLPAAPEASPTPPGGVRRNDLNLNYAVAKGIFSVWQGRDQDPMHTMSGMETLAATAVELGRREGLAALR